jgi:hypothetical protein
MVSGRHARSTPFAATELAHLTHRRPELQKLRAQMAAQVEGRRHDLQTVSHLSDACSPTVSCASASPTAQKGVDRSDVTAAVLRVEQLEKDFQSRALRWGHEIEQVRLACALDHRREELAVLKATLKMACSRFAAQHGAMPSSMLELATTQPELSPIVQQYQKLKCAGDTMP